MSKIVVILIFLLSLQAEDEYRLGEGVQVGSLPFYLGGYFSLDYKNIGDTNRYRLDDIAVLGYGSYDKLSYMAELEYKEFYVETHRKDANFISRNHRLYIERVYLEYNLNENYMFKVGKYNSPIGFWNLLPINVLRETTSNPMSSELLYPKFTTGASASYSSFNYGELKIDIMLQNNEDLDDDYNNYELDEHYGFGISYESDNYALKLNGGSFHTVPDHAASETLYYFLVSAKYETENYQLLSEVGSQKADSYITTNYAAYVQGLYRFSEKHIGIIRAESYDRTSSLTDDIAIMGYTYRPLYPIAIKSEYQFHSQSEQDQFLFSFSVLF